MRTAWIDSDGDVYLHLSDILFWIVRANGDPEDLKKLWESGEMSYPDYRGLSYQV